MSQQTDRHCVFEKCHRWAGGVGSKIEFGWFACVLLLLDWLVTVGMRASSKQAL